MWKTWKSLKPRDLRAHYNVQIAMDNKNWKKKAIQLFETLSIMTNNTMKRCTMRVRVGNVGQFPTRLYSFPVLPIGNTVFRSIAGR